MANKKLSKQKTAEMLGEAQSLYDDALAAMQHRVPYLIEQMAFYRGIQWGSTSPLGWIQDDFDMDEAREVLNYVRPTVRTAVSDILRSLPNPEVVPTANDQRAMARAEASQKLLRSFLRNGTVNFETLMRAETAAQIHGAAYYKVIWNPGKGKYHETPLVDPSTGEFEMDDFGVQRTERAAEGEVDVQFVDIVSALADPHAKSESEISHIFHRKLLATRVLDDQFPFDAFGEATKDRWSLGKADSGQSASEIVENDARSLASPISGGGASYSSSNTLAELVEYWEKPSNRFPGGRLVVFSGDVVVAIGPLPYGWPWVLRLGQNVIPNGLYPDGVVKDIIPIQRSINMSASKRREWLDKVLSPPLLVPHGSGINTDLFSDMAGELIEYNQGYTPNWMRVPDIPASMFNFESQAVDTLQTISTYSDISRGAAPAGYDSGRALAYLYEFQKAVHQPDIHLFRRDMSRVLSMCLDVARVFYSEGRMVRMIGDNNRWMTKPFKQADYDFDAEVMVEAFSGKPHSRALRYAEAIEMYQLGAFDPENPSAKALRNILEVDYEDAPTRHRKEAHYSRAKMENEAILDDPFYQAEMLDQDNHDCHIEIHQDFAVTPEFLELPKQAKDSFIAHLGEHEARIAEQTQAYAQESQMLAGQSQSPEGEAPAAKDPGIASPYDGGHSAYEESPEPGLPMAEGAPLPSPEELAGTLGS